MLYLKCQALRWVADEPQPGLVEVLLLDAAGREWTFMDKVAIFSADLITGQSSFPVDVVIACVELRRTLAPDGRELVTVSTAKPWGVETPQGVHEFVMLPGPARQSIALSRERVLGRTRVRQSLLRRGAAAQPRSSAATL